MTCEVVVMNKRGVALAADSAVTLVLGEGQKIYQNAEKLFQLSAVAPVGVMTYGSAELMGVPWETVIKIYTHSLGARRFDRLEQYADDFIRFIEGSDSLFPDSVQRQEFRTTVHSYWERRFIRPLSEPGEAPNRHPSGVVADLIMKDTESWADAEINEELGAAHGDRIISEYGDILDEIERELFGSLKLTDEARRGLRAVVKHLYTTNRYYREESGVVIAGMGELEPFPVMLNYRVGTLSAGRLRFEKIDPVRISQDCDATVMPFAQPDMIAMFYQGIYPDLKRRLVEIMMQSLGTTLTKKDRKLAPSVMSQLEKEVLDAFERELDSNYTQPLMAAVSALPRHELAAMAEALVSLTAFRARLSAAETDTVGGPIDVAVISKGVGFVWVKHKDLVQGASQNVIRVI